MYFLIYESFVHGIANFVRWESQVNGTTLFLEYVHSQRSCGFIRVIFLDVPLGLLFCWCFLVLLVWILWFAGVDFPKIHTSKHKHQQNLAGVTPENPVTRM